MNTLDFKGVYPPPPSQSDQIKNPIEDQIEKDAATLFVLLGSNNTLGSELQELVQKRDDFGQDLANVKYELAKLRAHHTPGSKHFATWLSKIDDQISECDQKLDELSREISKKRDELTSLAPQIKQLKHGIGSHVTQATTVETTPLYLNLEGYEDLTYGPDHSPFEGNIY